MNLFKRLENIYLYIGLVYVENEDMVGKDETNKNNMSSNILPIE